MAVWKYLRTKKDDCWLPYFMPHIWHTALAIVFSLGLIVGIWIAIEMLKLRGLI